MAKAMLIHDASGHTGDSSDLLFLDVDGVLHPVDTDYSFSSKFFSHLPPLEELLREFEFVDVVISSDSHRSQTCVRSRQLPETALALPAVRE
ncbi:MULTISPECIES: HAD domain-containing protein [unclassified Variovorax]|uniref:HAD domain-containing protein n=1 Tax=unclassified Variovorax TaxID=663243 RepID=UPI003F484D61